MIVAIAGSRSLNCEIPDEIIPECTEKIISGGAKGIDSSARNYALSHNILIEEILPAYDLYGIKAPLVRNEIIVQKSDEVFIFWDGKSTGSKNVMGLCKKHNKPCHIYLFENGSFIKK